MAATDIIKQEIVKNDEKSLPGYPIRLQWQSLISRGIEWATRDHNASRGGGNLD